jgi:hypothetical protein
MGVWLGCHKERACMHKYINGNGYAPHNINGNGYAPHNINGNGYAPITLMGMGMPPITLPQYILELVDCQTAPKILATNLCVHNHSGINSRVQCASRTKGPQIDTTDKLNIE